MTALNTAESLLPATRIDNLPPSDIWEIRTARSVTRWGRSGAVISVAGEIDASNATQLADYAHSWARCCQWLVLDLNDLDFIGTAGFSALKLITDRCADTMVRCTTVPGAAAARLLRICDPANTLPTASSVADALAGVPGFPPSR